MVIPELANDYSNKAAVKKSHGSAQREEGRAARIHPEGDRHDARQASQVHVRPRGRGNTMKRSASVPDQFVQRLRSSLA